LHQLPLADRLALARKRERWTTVYRDSPEIFQAFERAEDPQRKGAKRLAELARPEGQRILEVGCGTGWLTQYLAPSTGLHVAIEPESKMLTRAGDLSPAYPIRARGERLPIATGSFDQVVMSWVLLDLRPSVRFEVVRECERILVESDRSSPRFPNGIWVLENAGTGEFQKLRGIEDEHGYGEISPLIEDHGFQLIETVASEFAFASTTEAAYVLGAILGDEVGETVRAGEMATIPLDLAILFRPSAS
jgi:SAM-dependent methyltransferase